MKIYMIPQNTCDIRQFALEAKNQLAVVAAY